MSVVSAQISTIIHATEDHDRVKRVLDMVCPQDLFEAKSETRRLKGHHGNEIVTVTINVHRRLANSFFQNLWKLLPAADKAVIFGGLDRRLDNDGKLHIRLDKQEGFIGNLRLGDRDPIKIQVAFQTKGDYRAELRERLHPLGDLSEDLAG